MNDILHALWQSSADFYERFNMFPPDTRAQLRVMTEEFYETTEAALIGTKQELAEEGADLIVTLMGVLMARGVPVEDLQFAIIRVINKNDAKTRESHTVNASGKIAKRGRGDGRRT